MYICTGVTCKVSENDVVDLCTFSPRSYMTFAATNVVSCVTIIKFTKLITMFIVFASDALAEIISHPYGHTDNSPFVCAFENTSEDILS